MSENTKGKQMSEISEHSIGRLQTVSHNIENDIGIEVDLNQTVEILIKSYIDKSNQKYRANSAVEEALSGPLELTFTLKSKENK